MNIPKLSARSVLPGLASIGLLMFASAAGAATINILGANAPIPGPDDQYQTNFVALAQSPPPGGGAFNYYVDANPSPGQTFTTGSNPNGYVLSTLALYDADNSGGGFGSETFTLGLYSVSGSTATLITTYTSQSVSLADFTWFQWTNLGAILLPNTQYAYAMWANGPGWMNLGNIDMGYAGGQVATVPRAGGTLTFSSVSPWNASFDVGLTPITAITVGQATFSPSALVVPGTSVTAHAPVSGPGPYSFQWTTDGGAGGALTNIPGATSSNLVINTAGFADGLCQYGLVVSNNISYAIGQVGILQIQHPIAIPGVIGLKFGFAPGYATPDALLPTDNTGVATGQLVPPSFSPLTVVGNWNNLMANVQPPYDNPARSAAINQTWTIDRDSAGNPLSGVTLTPGGFNDGWFSGGTGCAAGRLLYDCWKFNGGNGQVTAYGHPFVTLTVAGLPQRVYDVIVYINNNNGNYWGNAQANTVIAQGSPDLDNTSYGFNGASADPCGLATPLHTYSGFNGGNPANSVNYVRMSGVETYSGSIIITVALFGGGDMGVSGIELVPVPTEDLKLVKDTTPNFADTVVGDTVVFSGAYSNVPPVSLQWMKIGGGATNTLTAGVVTATNNDVVTSTLTLNNVQLSDSGVYQIKAASATNSAFYKFSSPSTLRVGNHPAPVNGIVVDYAAQAGPAPFYPPWTTDTSSSNLIYGFYVGDGSPGTILPGPGNFGVDGASLNPAVLADGVLSIDRTMMVSCGVISDAGQSATFTLMTNSSPLGFDLNVIQVFGGWGDAGRRDQQYEVRYATVTDPTNFVSLISTYYVPDDPLGTGIATRTTLVPANGVLAHNVAAVEMNWNVLPQHLNGYAFYSEVAVLGAPSTRLVAVPPAISASASGGNLVVSGTGGTANSSYALLEATNLAAPVRWTTNSTGLLDGTGSFSISIPMTATPPSRFFRVSVP